MILATGLPAIWISMHLVGLAAAWLVRLHAGRRREGLAQLGFFACLPLVASATIVGQQMCLTGWPLSAATLAVMIVLATADLSPRGESQIQMQTPHYQGPRVATRGLSAR
jgi:hypothetical protein